MKKIECLDFNLTESIKMNQIEFQKSMVTQSIKKKFTANGKSEFARIAKNCVKTFLDDLTTTNL